MFVTDQCHLIVMQSNRAWIVLPKLIFLFAAEFVMDIAYFLNSRYALYIVPNRPEKQMDKINFDKAA